MEDPVISKPGPVETRTEAIADFFSSYPSVKFLRLQWIDYSGVLRARTVSKAIAWSLATGKTKYSVAQNCMIIPISTAPACFPDGIEEWSLQPDWTSLIPCGYRDSHALVFCHTAHMGLDSTLERCPRTLLAGAVDLLSNKYETQILIGFEIEFVFLDDDWSLASSADDTVGYSMTAGLRTKNLDIIEDVVAALEKSSIEVYHFHVELDRQFEIALMPLAPLQAVDALMTTAETIKTVSLMHGLRASLTPKPVIQGPKNGIHAHLSLTHAAAGVAHQFLAGVLAKQRALCAFGLANFDGYERVVGDCAGQWVGFGTGSTEFLRDSYRFLKSRGNP